MNPHMQEWAKPHDPLLRRIFKIGAAIKVTQTTAEFIENGFFHKLNSGPCNPEHHPNPKHAAQSTERRNGPRNPAN